MKNSMKRPKLPVVGKPYTTDFYGQRLLTVRVVTAQYTSNFGSGVAVTWRLLQCHCCGAALALGEAKANQSRGPYDADLLLEWKVKGRKKPMNPDVDAAWAEAAREGVRWLDGIPIASRASRDETERTHRASLLKAGKANFEAYLDLYENQVNRKEHAL